MSDDMTLSIVCKGEVLSSNLPEFRDAVVAFVGAINRELVTDEQFGQAEIDVKRLKSIEEGTLAAKEKALRDAETLHALFVSLDEIAEIPRQARLDLSGLIDRQKKAVRAQLVADALNRIECAAHLRLKNFGAVVESSIKGKRTLDSMQKALDIIVGSLNAQIAAAKAIIAEWEATNQERVPDADALEIEQPETVRLKLQARTDARKAAEERKRLEEEQARERKRLADEAAAERAARVKAEAEAKAQEERNYTPQGESLPTQVLPQAAPIVESLPTSEPAQEFALTAEENADEELARLCFAIRAAFLPIRAVRESLKHQRNIDLAKAFASNVNVSFKWLEKGGDK
jgi:hypothetical protein